MANLTESASFDANIYRVEKTDPVLGFDGSNLNIANLQAQALANRTQWLKSRVDLGARFTLVNAPAISSNGVTIAATPDDLKGSLVRLNSTSGPTAYYQLPDAGTLADGANVVVSHETSSGYQYITSNANAIYLKAFTSQNIIDLITGVSANQHTLLPNSVVRLFKLSATTWGMFLLKSESEIPAGIVSAWAVNAPPHGWLPCEGQAIDRTVYARLFANIGTVFGIGNGTTTFNIPDLRGEFIRGWANARSVDTGRTFGSFQADDFKSHQHLNMSVSAPTTRTDSLSPGSGIFVGGGSSVNTQATGGTETRPRNVALMYCIKY